MNLQQARALPPEGWCDRLQCCCSDCWWAWLIIWVQTMVGLVMDAVMIGIIFARISHPKYRGRTIAISDSAVISRRDGVLKFMFRIADFRRTQVRLFGLLLKKLMHDSGASRGWMLRALAAVSLVCPVPAWSCQAQQSLSESLASSLCNHISTSGLLGCSSDTATRSAVVAPGCSQLDAVLPRRTNTH